MVNFEELARKNSFCLGGGCDRGPLRDSIGNCSDLDTLLSPELDTDEVRLSLLETRQAELYCICISHALRAINDSEGGWLASCGCWHLWRPMRSPDQIRQLYGQ